MPCCVFEVLQSTWVERWNAQNGASNAELRHFVITFLGVNAAFSRGVHFECLATDLEVNVNHATHFETVVADAAQF